MVNYDFDFQLDDFMLYCRTQQLRPKTMASYEQTLRLFQRWLKEELQIETVDKITEPIIRKYIDDLRADTMKEALQLLDRQLQTNTIVQAIHDVSAEICSTIQINTAKLGILIGQSVFLLSNQLDDIQNDQRKHAQEMLENQNLILALQKKANATSLQLAEDSHYMRMLAENSVVRRHNK